MARTLRVEVLDNDNHRALVSAIMDDYRDAPLDQQDRAMLDFALKLTLRPGDMDRTDVETLRSAGFDDEGVHHITQVTALFNYYNRVADGLGIDMEDDW